MARGRRKVRASNQVSRAEYRAIAGTTKLHWSQWEKRVEGVFVANGWEVWRDRVIPRSVLRTLHLPRDLEDNILELLQKIARRQGYPDLYVGKKFAGGYEQVHHPLRQYTGLVPMYRGEIAVTGMVECKSGAATTTAKQDLWLELASLCPGQFSYVARPTAYPELVALAGGKEPLT